MELEITELRLGLPGGCGGACSVDKSEKKRVFSDISEEGNGDLKIQIRKSQVVGWPPVCSYRIKNSTFNDNKEKQQQRKTTTTSKMYVKVSMDGAPFLRKIDLGMHNDYSDLATALEKLFLTLMKDAERCEYVAIYEDKDGDWMLAGDVPWEMFIETCKRVRIMKRADANGFGLQPSGGASIYNLSN